MENIDITKLPEGAIGHKSTMTEEEISGKVIDGPTGFVFPDIDSWKAHISPISGTVPTDPEYLKQTTTPNYDEVAAAAVDRGSEKSAE